MSNIEEIVGHLDSSNNVIKKKQNKSKKKNTKTNITTNTSIINKSYTEQKEALTYFITKVKDIIKNYMKYLIIYKRLDILSINEYNIVNQELAEKINVAATEDESLNQICRLLRGKTEG